MAYSMSKDLWSWWLKFSVDRHLKDQNTVFLLSLMLTKDSPYLVYNRPQNATFVNTVWQALYEYFGSFIKTKRFNKGA